MTINLREFYPHYTDDDYWDVPDEVAAFLQDSERREANYRRRVSYHKAYYSLDLDDGIEGCAILSGPTVDEFFEQQLMYRHLQEALASLPAKQARRIYRHYILGKSKSAIARAEGVSESSVFESISRGLRSMKRFFAP